MTLRMLRVTRGDEVVQEAPPGFGYPMLTMADRSRQQVVPADLRAPLSSGEAVMGEITARNSRSQGGRRHPPGIARTVRVVPVRIGAIVPDQELRWSEIVIGASQVPGLEIDRPYAVVAWGTGAESRWPPRFAFGPQIRVSGSWMVRKIRPPIACCRWPWSRNNSVNSPSPPGRETIGMITRSTAGSTSCTCCDGCDRRVPDGPSSGRRSGTSSADRSLRVLAVEPVEQVLQCALELGPGVVLGQLRLQPHDVLVLPQVDALVRVQDVGAALVERLLGR